MGMAASQARFLALTARKNNVEYEGQQINQQRTVLANKTAKLIEQQLGLSVPICPGKTEFTRVQYTGYSGSLKITVPALGVVPSNSGNPNEYIVTIQKTQPGDGMEADFSSKKVIKDNVITANVDLNPVISTTTTTYNGIQTLTSLTNQEIADHTEQGGVSGVTSGYYLEPFAANDVTDIQAKAVQYGATHIYKRDANGDISQWVQGTYDSTATYYVFFEPDENDPYDSNGAPTIDITDFVTTTTTTMNSIPASEISQYYVQNSDTWRKATTADFEPDGNNYQFKTGVVYAKADENGTEVTTYSGYTVEGRPVQSFAEFASENEEAAGRIETAILNTWGFKDDGTPVMDPNNFVVYQVSNGNGKFETHYALQSDLDIATGPQGTGFTKTYSYISNYMHQIEEDFDNTLVEFDPSSGRIIQIEIPSQIVNGEVMARQTIKLTAEEIVDEAAYNAAIDKYNYQQFEYDREIERINKQTEEIQMQDKNLEIRLQNLDTEQKSLDTELDAVKKVLQGNIEDSFKVFNG